MRKVVSQLQEKLTGKCGYEQMPRLLYILYRSLIVVLLVKKPWQAHLVVLHSFWAVWSHYRVKSSTVRRGGRECVNISITFKRVGSTPALYLEAGTDYLQSPKGKYVVYNTS